MSKESDLERQLADLKKSKAFVLDKLDECMRLPDKVKAVMWDEVVPIIKAVFENKIKGQPFDRREVAEIVFDKAIKAVIGPDVGAHLEKL